MTKKVRTEDSSSTTASSDHDAEEARSDSDSSSSSDNLYNRHHKHRRGSRSRPRRLSGGSADEEAEEEEEDEDSNSAVNDDTSGDSDAIEEASEEDEDDDNYSDHDDKSDDESADLPVALKLQKRLAAGLGPQLHQARQRQHEARTNVRQKIQTLTTTRRKETRGGDDDDRRVTKSPEKGKSSRLPRPTPSEQSEQPPPQMKKKKSKHAPTEVSSRRSDFYRQNRHFNLNASGLGVTLGPGYKPRDPRYSELLLATTEGGAGANAASAAASLERAERDYAFLHELRDTEIAQLERRVRARSLTGRKGHALRRRLGVTMNDDEEGATDDRARLVQLRRDKGEWERRQIDRDARKAVQTKLPPGRHVARRKQKELLLEAKYEELRKRKGDQAVEKAVTKRLKKKKRRDLPVDRA